MKDEEADARAINAQPWEPLPGMVKRECPECQYFFAAPAVEPEAVLLCPDCAAAGTGVQLPAAAPEALVATVIRRPGRSKAASGAPQDDDRADPPTPAVPTRAACTPEAGSQ
jgi:hypothetical protein